MTDRNFIEEICGLDVIKITFGEPTSRDSTYKKCSVRLIETSKGSEYQFERLTEKQAFHENVSKSELTDRVCFTLENQFRQSEFFTPEYIYSVRLTPKGKLLHNRRRNTEKLDIQSHNREKKYIIDMDNVPPVFSELGIIGMDGKIVSQKYDKFKQICRFIEFINDVVANDKRECYNIVDFGCGKSYLTFVVYHYMTKIMGRKVCINGFDLKSEVINNCNALAQKYGYDGLKFHCMDIKDYKPAIRPDMVLTLHACDVATDYALYNAYVWQADYIFSVPCCQHEMNSFVKASSLTLLTDYGLLKERFCALATDAQRAKLLEYCGYNVDVLEFIDIEHSPKNVLIRAKRATRTDCGRRARALCEIRDFEEQFSSEITLKKLLMSNQSEFMAGDNRFDVICGRSSMLIKDALQLRRDVFGTEQNYTAGASRDDSDEIAWFVNVYCDGRIAATSRMIPTDNDGERLCGKIAVRKIYRSCGLGKLMLDALEKIAASENVKLLCVNAQKHALGFYNKLGFVQSGNEYSEEEILMLPLNKPI